MAVPQASDLELFEKFLGQPDRYTHSNLKLSEGFSRVAFELVFEYGSTLQKSAVRDAIAGDGVRTVLVESPDRFARDLTVQLTGHDFLKGLGITLIPTTSPDFFVEDTPTAVLVRQVLGAIAQFEKASLVAKMRAARDRRIAAGEKCGGRRSHLQIQPEVVALAKELRRKRRKGGRLSLREISRELAERGHLNQIGRPFSAVSVRNMLAQA
jgi:DNA invertase Pin-like site-specific DNA recombinase